MKTRFKIATLAGSSVMLTLLLILIMFNLIMNRQIDTNAREAVSFAAGDLYNDENILYCPEMIDLKMNYKDIDYNKSPYYNNTEKMLIEWLQENTVSGIQKVKIGNGTYYVKLDQYEDDLTYDNLYVDSDEEIEDDESVGWLSLTYVDVTGEPELIRKMSLFFLTAALTIGILASVEGYFIGRRLEQNSTAQKQFFENTSHELKTPLTSIRGYAEGIEKGVITDYKKAGRVIISQTEKMSSLIEEILLSAKLESGAVQLHREPVEMSELVENCLMPLEGAIMNRGLSVSFESSELTVNADPDRLEQAISNLLTNAIKYAKSCLSVTLKEHFLTIQNDCADLSNNEIKHLFDRFYTGKNGNTGIGLALAKDMVELHGWKLEAKRIPDGIEFCIIMK